MKILAFSDLHCDAETTRQIIGHSGPADVLVAAGDFAKRGKGAAQILQLLQELNKPTILVSGNHDNSDELHSFSANWENGHLLHGQKVKIDGVVFFGVGREIPVSHKSGWNESIGEAEALQLLKTCPKNCVLVTHSPPKNCADLQKSGNHTGSLSIRQIVEEKHPVLHLCGHVHYSWGTSCKIGETPVHNLGPRENWFEV